MSLFVCSVLCHSTRLLLACLSYQATGTDQVCCAFLGKHPIEGVGPASRQKQAVPVCTRLQGPGSPTLTRFLVYMFFLKAWCAMNNEHRDPSSPPFPIKCKTSFYLPGIHRAVSWPSSTAATTSYQMAGSEPAGDGCHCLSKNRWVSGRGQIGGDRQLDDPGVQGVPRREEFPGHLWPNCCI